VILARLRLPGSSLLPTSFRSLFLGSRGRRGPKIAPGSLASHGWQIAAVLVVVAVIVAGKHYYRHASAGELSWILAPTSWLAGAVSGGDFVYEAGAGWIDRDLLFLIAPPCAGLHFALAAFLALALGALPAMRTPRAAAAWLLAAAAVAYAATLVVNTARIAIAIAMHRGTIDIGALDRGEVHRIEGIVVYLGGLCALYALARAVRDRRTS
jgi:exosortase K